RPPNGIPDERHRSYSACRRHFPAAALGGPRPAFREPPFGLHLSRFRVVGRIHPGRGFRHSELIPRNKASTTRARLSPASGTWLAPNRRTTGLPRPNRNSPRTLVRWRRLHVSRVHPRTVRKQLSLAIPVERPRCASPSPGA